VTAVPARPARLRLLVLVGVLLLVPRLVLAWFLGLDVLQLIASLLLVAGLVILGVALYRLLLARNPTRPVWPPALAGAGGVLLAGLLTPLLRGTPVAYTGSGIVPAPVVLFQYAWTLVGAVWVIGLVFVFGSLSLGLQRRR
jgi:hypothetical protein